MGMRGTENQIDASQFFDKFAFEGRGGKRTAEKPKPAPKT
jgi:hypothetical protein